MKKQLIILLFALIPFIAFSGEKCEENKCSIESKVENAVETDIDNKEVNFKTITKQTFDGEKYIIYTALWCPHCRAEYAHLQKIYEKYKDNFNIILFIAGDTPKEDIAKYMISKGYTFPIYYDEGNFYGNFVYNIKYYPTVLKYKKGKESKELKNILFNIDTYYNLNKYKINKSVRNKLKDIEVITVNGDKKNVLDIIPTNAIVMYGAPYCPDCVEELKRIEQIKENREFVYLIDSKKYSYNEFVEYAKNSKHKNIYYVNSNIIRERFNIKWIPSVLEVKDDLFLNSFMPNNIEIIR